MYDFSISYRSTIAVLYPLNEKAKDWESKNMRHKIGRNEQHFDNGILLTKKTAISVIQRIMRDYLTVGQVA